MNKKPLLEIKDLTIGYRTDDGHLVEIVDHVSFTIYEGEIYGLVGESGCGKTITALAILKLLPKPVITIMGGNILLKGRDILTCSPSELQAIRGKEIGVIFQEPGAALDPLMPISKQLNELFSYHTVTFDKDARIKELLKRVGFPDPARILAAYPHELSGGMLQRVMIALALLLRPSLIIADEPTTALDVTVQAQIMELLIEMQRELGTSVLFITHNLNLIAQYADRLAVMYAGRIVEESDCELFLKGPLHPYAQRLLAALPDLHAEHPTLRTIPGQVPQPADYEQGCRFRPRCESAFEKCHVKPDLESYQTMHKVACFLYPENHTNERS